MKTLSVRLLIFTILFCNSIISCQVDKHDLRGNDFRLFKDTKAWNLAKAVQEQDTLEIERQVKGKAVPVDFVEEIYGQSLLQLAVRHELLNSCKKLLNLGADANHADSYNGNTPMHNCAKVVSDIDDTTILSLLISYGGNPNGLTAITQGPGSGGAEKSVLMVACSNISPNFNRVKYLVEKGADINFMNSGGYSVLFNCFLINNYKAILYLLKTGKLNYKKVIFAGFSGKLDYIQNLMRADFISLDSPEYKYKLEVIEFLKNNGIDYKSTPIPESIKKRAKEYHPNNWEDYLSKY